MKLIQLSETKIKKMPTSSGKLLFAGMPNNQMLNELIDCDCIWNLAEELDYLLPYEKLVAKEVIWGNIRDFHQPDDTEKFVSQLKHVVNLLQEGKTVFVHCFGGVGRTGMILAAIKMSLDEMTPDEALKEAFKYSGGPEKTEQFDFIYKLYNELL